MIINTRPDPDELSRALRQAGAEVLELPLIEIRSLKWALPQVESSTWLVFTSANGVAAASSRKELKSMRVAVVGEATASAAKAAGFEVSLVSSVPHGEGLARELISVRGDSALLLRAEKAALELPDMLRKAGWRIWDLAVYRGQPSALSERQIERVKALERPVVVFTSSEAAKNFINYFKPIHYRAVVIGPKTMDTALGLGFKEVQQAASPTVSGLVSAVQELCAI